MSVSLFLMLLTIFSAMTGVLVEGIKSLLAETNIKYSTNLLAFIVALIVGVFGTATYYAIDGIPFTFINIVCMLLMGLASSMGAMVGYDKVIQTIKQMNTGGNVNSGTA